MFQEKVAHWIANDAQPFSSWPDSNGESTASLDPDAHAHAVIRALESRCEALGVYPAMFPAAASGVAGIAAYRAAEQRHAPPGRRPPDRRMSVCFRQDAGTKRS